MVSANRIIAVVALSVLVGGSFASGEIIDSLLGFSPVLHYAHRFAAAVSTQFAATVDHHPRWFLPMAILRTVYGSNARAFVLKHERFGRACATEAAWLRQWDAVRATPYFGALFEQGLNYWGYAQGEHNSDPMCQTYMDAGLVPDVGEPDFGLLSTMHRLRVMALYATAAALGVMLGSVLLVLTCVYLYLRTTIPIQVSAPVSPFNKGQFTAAFDEWVGNNPLEVRSDKGHETLAYVRQALENFTQEWLYRFSSSIKDIGGSLRRNARLGRRLHICFPDLDAMDHSKLQAVAGNVLNDVHNHRMQTCNRKSLIGYMSYTDFHISASDLADYCQAPTVIITHPFGDWIGKEHVFFPTEANPKGEGHCNVSPGAVTMTTRMGSVYTHGYHHWKDEGVVIGKRRACTYYKIGDYGDSIVILLLPTTGSFNRQDPYRLKTSGVEGVTHLNDGTDVHIEAGDYVFSCENGNEIRVQTSTIIRTAIVAMSIPRGPAFIDNVSASLRARFAADHQPWEAIQKALLLVMKLADSAVMDVADARAMIPDDIATLSWFQRKTLRVLLWAWSCTPRFLTSVHRRIWLAISGPSKQKSWVPWMWTDTYVPNYECVIAPNKVTLTDPKKKVTPKQPFRAAGQTAAAPSVPVNKRGSLGNKGKRDNKPGNKGTAANHKSAPRTQPKGGKSKPAVQSNVTKQVVPREPLPDVVKYALRWIEKNLHNGAEVARTCRRTASSKPGRPSISHLLNINSVVSRLSKEAARDLQSALRDRAESIDRAAARTARMATNATTDPEPTTQSTEGTGENVSE